MTEMIGPATTPQEPAGELIAVRHGESIANLVFASTSANRAVELRRTYRDADIPLSPHGREQATCLGRCLAKEPDPHWIYSSPYLRATETTSLICESLNSPDAAPIIVDERLRDREMGQFELMTPQLIEQEFPTEAQRRQRAGEFYYRPPGGESLADVALRLRGFLRDIHPEDRTLLVCHDAVVLMLRFISERIAEPDLRSIVAVANASVSRWSWPNGGQLRLTQYNSTVGEVT